MCTWTFVLDCKIFFPMWNNFNEHLKKKNKKKKYFGENIFYITVFLKTIYFIGFINLYMVYFGVNLIWESYSFDNLLKIIWPILRWMKLINMFKKISATHFRCIFFPLYNIAKAKCTRYKNCLARIPAFEHGNWPKSERATIFWHNFCLWPNFHYLMNFFILLYEKVISLYKKGIMV